jgi:hypothetical protein
VVPSTTTLGIVYVSYILRMLAKFSATDPVCSNKSKRVRENLDVVCVIKFNDARESGISEGYCTALRVNTI